jgi:hypothetical protein
MMGDYRASRAVLRVSDIANKNTHCWRNGHYLIATYHFLYL